MSKTRNHRSRVSGAPVCRAAYISPLGPLELCATDKGLFSVDFVSSTALSTKETEHFVYLCKLFDRYFQGRVTTFDIELDLTGTPYQISVWKEILTIPYGSVISYLELALRLGSPHGARAVAGACAANRLPVIVPCHRVISASGAIGGYSAGGGVELKRALLQLEHVQLLQER